MKKKRCEIIVGGHGNYEIRRRFEPPVRFCPVSVEILRIDPPSWVSSRTGGSRNAERKEQAVSVTVEDPVLDLKEIFPSISSDSELEETSTVCSDRTNKKSGRLEGPKKKTVCPELTKKPLPSLNNGKKKEREPKISTHVNGSSATVTKGVEPKKSTKEVLAEVVNGKPKGNTQVPSKTSESSHNGGRSSDVVKKDGSSRKNQSGPPSGSRTGMDVSLKKKLKHDAVIHHQKKTELNGKEGHLKKPERASGAERVASFEEQLSATCKSTSVPKASVTAMTLNGSHSKPVFQKSSNAETVNGLVKHKNTAKITAFPEAVKVILDEVDSSASSQNGLKSELKNPNKLVTNPGVGPVESLGKEKHGLLNGKNVQSTSKCKLSTHPIPKGTTSTETGHVVLQSEKSSFKSKESADHSENTIDSGTGGPEPDKLKTAVVLTPASLVAAGSTRKVPAHAKVRNPFFAAAEDGNSLEASAKCESAIKIPGKNALFLSANLTRSDANTRAPKPTAADDGPAKLKPTYPGPYLIPRGPEKGINPFRVNPVSDQSNGFPRLLPQQKLMQPFKIPRKVKSPPPPPPPADVEGPATFKRIRIDPNPRLEKLLSPNERCEAPLISSSLGDRKKAPEQSVIPEKKISCIEGQMDFESKASGFVSDKESDDVSTDDDSDDDVKKLNPPSVRASNFEDEDDLDILQIHPEDEDDDMFF